MAQRRSTSSRKGTRSYSDVAPSTKGIARSPRYRSGVVAEAVKERVRSTKRKRQDDVTFWEDRLNLGKREAEPYMVEFARNMEFYVGQQEPVVDPWMGEPRIASENILTINRILPSLATMNAQIMWRIPWFRVENRQPVLDLAQNPEIRRENAEYTLNYVMQTPRNNLLGNARLMVLSSELAYGALKVTYTPDEGHDPEAGKPEELGELTVKVDPETGMEVAEIEGGIPKVDPKTGKLMRRGRNKFVLDTRNPSDYYRIDWVDWRDFVHDPEGTNDIHDHRWVAQRFSWSYSDFMENTLFTNKEDIHEAARYIDDTGYNFKTRRLDRGGGRKQVQHNISGPPEDSETDMMRLWGYQVWDLDAREVVYLVDGYDKLVGREPIYGWVEDLPYVFCKFNEVPGEWFPYPDITAARPLARSYNLSRSLVMTHRKRSKRKYETVKGNLDAQNMEYLKNHEDGQVVIVKQRGQLGAIEDAKIDPAIYADMDRDILDFSEILGSAPEARGAAQSDTATQAAIIEQRGTARENDKRALVGQALSQAANLMLSALQANLDTQLAVRITGPTGNTWDKMVDRTAIRGDFESKVSITELEPNDERVKEAKLINVLKIMGPQFAFLSPTFTRKFFKAIGDDDPALVQEFQKIAALMLTVGAQKPGSANGGGEPGGSKETGQGPEQGRTTGGGRGGRASADQT